MADNLSKTLPGHRLAAKTERDARAGPQIERRRERELPLPVGEEDRAASRFDSHYFAGLARYQRGHTDSAILHFQKAIKCGTGKVSCLLMIALCQMKKGNFREAKRCLRTGLGVEGISETESIALRHQLALCLQAMEKQQEGKDLVGASAGVSAWVRAGVRAEPEETADAGLAHDRPAQVDMIERVSALNQRLENIRRKHTPIANSIAQLKRTDPPVIYEGEEQSKRPIALQIAVSCVAIGAILVLSYLTVVGSRAGEQEHGVRAIGSDFAEGKSDPLPRVTSPARVEKPLIASDKRSISGLKAEVLAKKTLYALDTPVLVVRGLVTNLSGSEKVEVVIGGKLFDRQGNILSSASAPCGKISSYELIGETDSKNIDRLYQENGAVHRCSIQHGHRQRYQLIFRGIPKNLGGNFTVEIDPLEHPVRP